MVTRNDRETIGYAFHWKIENVSSLWWLKTGEEIRSPTFIVDALEGTKWSLGCYPMGKEKKEFLDLCLYREKDCSGPDAIEINYKFILHQDYGIYKLVKLQDWSRFLKGDCKIYYPGRLENVYYYKNKSFLPEDTLTVQCIIWKGQKEAEEETNVKINRLLYGRTVLKVKRQYFKWRIEELSNLKSNFRNNYKNDIVDFDLVLNAQLDSFENFSIDFNSFDVTVKYFSMKVSVLDSKGIKMNSIKNKYSFINFIDTELFSTLDFHNWFENEKLHLQNDCVSLDFEFVFSTVKSIDCGKNSRLWSDVSKVKSQKMPVLRDDMKFLYNEGLCSDMELRTMTQTFLVHRAILSARSPVFRQMFSCNMKENIFGQVYITDLEDDTVHQMLLYMYTDSLEHLQFESALKLYVAADKYDIFSLKKSCCFFLIKNLHPTNACNVLIQAIQLQDDDLINTMQNYIQKLSKDFFCKQEWKDFMKIHDKLALNIMYKKICKE